MLAPVGVIHSVNFAGAVAFQIVRIGHEDGIRFLVEEANKEEDITDVLAADIGAQKHGAAWSGHAIGKRDGRELDLARPRRTNGCPPLWNGDYPGRRFEGTAGIVIGQEIVPQGLVGKAAGDGRVRLRSGKRRRIELGIGEVDGDTCRAWLFRAVFLGDDRLVQRGQHTIGSLGHASVVAFFFHQLDKIAQINVGRGHISAEDTGERLGIGAGARHNRLPRSL